MRLIILTIISILFFTTSCIQTIVEEETTIVLPPRVDKKVIKEKFADLPFDSEEEIKIALLLPLSGKHKKLGKALYDAAQLALFDHGDPRIVIYPFDTKGSEFTAISVMNEVVAEGIKIIVGPVFSKVVKSISPIASKNDITIFSFSNNSEVANNNIYVMGLDVRQQVQRIVTYAIENDIKYFSALLPGNNYGSQIVTELRKVIEIYGGMVLKTEFYVPGSDVNVNVRRVVRSLIEIPVDREGQPLFKHLMEGEEIPLDEEGRPLYQDIKDFKTALLIAENSKKLVEIADLLEKYNFPDESQVIGLSGWDGSEALQKDVFSGAWFTGLPKNNFELYHDHFDDIYTYTPAKISSFAYDIISVISALVASGEDITFKKEMVLNSVGFSGISGVFRFKNSGVVERLLEVYKADGGRVNTIDPANFQFVKNSND